MHSPFQSFVVASSDHVRVWLHAALHAWVADGGTGDSLCNFHIGDGAQGTSEVWPWFYGFRALLDLVGSDYLRSEWLCIGFEYVLLQDPKC